MPCRINKTVCWYNKALSYFSLISYLFCAHFSHAPSEGINVGRWSSPPINVRFSESTASSVIGRERRLAIVSRKPTLKKSGVLTVAGYGLSWEFTLSAENRHTVTETQCRKAVVYNCINSGNRNACRCIFIRRWILEEGRYGGNCRKGHWRHRLGGRQHIVSCRPSCGFA